MIDSVNSGMMAQMSGIMGSMQRPQGAEQMFQKVDSSGDGSIDSVELSSMATHLYETSGQQIDVDNAIADYDADGDGGLNGEELKSMLDGNGIAPPEKGGQSGKGGRMAGPPPGGGGEMSSSDGIQAYLQQLMAESSESESEDLFTQFLEKISGTAENGQNYSPFNALV